MGCFTTATRGTDDGQFCADLCGHDDCQWMRTQVASPYTICGQPIGEGSKIYATSDRPSPHGHAHAVCVWKQHGH